MESDRSLTLLHLRKTFTALMKLPAEPASSNSSTASGAVSERSAKFDQLLPLFSRLMSMFTPEELVHQFKEILLFTHQLGTALVQEIKRRANVEDTSQAAADVYAFLRPDPPDARGWLLLKSITFIVNSGHAKVYEPLCSALLPSTLVKVFYLFLDLPPPTKTLPRDSLVGTPIDSTVADEKQLKSRLYDSLVQLMSTLCAQEAVAAELIQHDDLVLLFMGASTQCPSEEHSVWRDANFLFLCTLVGRALSPSVVKYVHSKGCLGHYLKNIRNQALSAHEKSVLISNLLDLLRSSADTTAMLVDDFSLAGGYQAVAEFCLAYDTSIDDIKQVFHALKGLLTSGDETVAVHQPTTPLTNYKFKLPSALSRSTGTVRIPDAYLVLEKCFNGGEAVCLLTLDALLEIYRMERMNYFILETHSSLYLLVEGMKTKSMDAQGKVLELVEYVLRDLNYIPCKELTALNVQLRAAVGERNWARVAFLLDFFERAMGLNTQVREAYKELLVLESLTQCLGASLDEEDKAGKVEREMTERVLALLFQAANGSQSNTQFISENLDSIKVLRPLLLAPEEVSFTDATQRLLRLALLRAKNLEHLFSSLLQLLFSDPGNLTLCAVVLGLLMQVLLESHKVRIMFRKSGGYICLMTLLLHMEGALGGCEKKGNIIQHIALIFRILTGEGLFRWSPEALNKAFSTISPI